MKQLLFYIILIIGIEDIYAQPGIFGLTKKGGDGFGVIFKTDNNGNNYQLLHKFTPSSPGANPQYTHMIQGADGSLYGMTYYGGAINSGTIFKYDPITNEMTVIRQLNYSYSNNTASYPFGSLILASNGLMYGMGSPGSYGGGGKVFSFNPITGAGNQLLSFGNSGTSYGNLPYGSFIQASDSNLYAVNSSGGNNNNGTIFKYYIASNSFTKVFDFNCSTNGCSPKGELIEAPNGILYGTTSNGGNGGSGVIFSFNQSSNSFNIIHHLDSTADGRSPFSGLQILNDSILIGTTTYGGVNFKGTIFTININSGAFTKVLDLDGTNLGSNPNTYFTKASNGKFYTVCSFGGQFNCGTVLEMDPFNLTFVKRADFNSTQNGKAPKGALIEKSGVLYGLANVGGTLNLGTLYSFDINTGNLTAKHHLGFSETGSEPLSTMCYANNGKLYGFTNKGGTNNKGVFFEFNPNNKHYRKLLDFNGINGENPLDIYPMQASNGKIYFSIANNGTTYSNPIYEYDPISDNLLIKCSTYLNATHGAFIEFSPGKLLGISSYGGSSGRGQFYIYDIISNSIQTKASFTTNDGKWPTGTPLLANNGKVYGTTSSGGPNDNGTIYEFDINTNIITTKKMLNSILMSNAYGGLIQHSNGKLYGLASVDNNVLRGGIFEYDLNIDSLTISKIFSDSKDGKNAWSSLAESSDGLLWGLAQEGGYTASMSTYGTMFNYNITTKTLTQKVNFVFTNGAGPVYSAPTLICQLPTIENKGTNVIKCKGSNYSFNLLSPLNYDSIIWKKEDSRIQIGQNELVINNISISDTGKYYCELKNACGTTINFLGRLMISKDSINISSTICSDSSITVGANTFNSSGIYTTVLQNTFGCDSIVVLNLTVHTVPSIKANTNAFVSCPAQPITLNGSGGISYTWNNNITNNVAFTPTQTKDYIVKGIDSNGCYNYDTIKITVSDCIPNNDICSGSISLCNSDIVNGTTKYATPINDVDVSLWNCNSALTKAVWYEFTTTSPKKNVEIIVNSACKLGGDLQIEVFKPIGSTSCPTSTYSWTSVNCTTAINKETTRLTINSISLLDNTKYYVLIDDYSNDECDFNIKAYGVADVDAGNDIFACKNQTSFNLTGQTPYGGYWTGEGIVDSLIGILNPQLLSLGNHSLTYHYGTCSDERKITITEPTLNLQDSVNVCFGNCINLSANANQEVYFSSSLNYTSNAANNNLTIPDNSITGIASEISVSGLNASTPDKICLNINHTWDADLTLFLINPNGKEIILSNKNGGSGDNYVNSCFTNIATKAVFQGTVPYTDNFYPDGENIASLSMLNNNGIWKLKVIDGFAGDVGTILNWTITFTNYTDSIKSVNYTWSPTTWMTDSNSLNPEICSSNTINYTLSSTNNYGCFNEKTILVKSQNFATNNYVSICEGESYTINNHIYTSTGTYIDTLASSLTCDSVVTTYLEYKPNSTSYLEIETCYQYNFNGIIINSSGLYTDTITNAYGCDSIITLNIVIYESTTALQNIVSCNSYNWLGNEYTSSGIYNAVITNTHGCDSLMTLNLLIVNSSNSSEIITACDSFIWNGNTLILSGLYSDTIPNAVGCDSIITLDLTILNSSHSYISTTACNSYLWNDNLFTSSGFYYDTISSITGCDSILILNLTINNSTSSFQNKTTCTNYNWNGNTYISSGVYYDTILNTVGCDSLMTLNLIINNAFNISNIVSIFQGDSILINGNYQSQPGVYIDSLFSINGCDSVITTTLTVLQKNIVWPGDANADTVANNLDLLQIGLYYNESGFTRDSISNYWIGNSSLLWSSQQVNGKNKNHVDCNGDGIVNNNDTLAIYQNYGLTHPLGLNREMQGAYDLYTVLPKGTDYISGDTVEIEIWAGTQTNPIDSIYGIAYTINIDPLIIKPGSLKYNTDNTWLSNGSYCLQLSKTFENIGLIDGANTRTNLLNQNGFGKLGTALFIINNNLDSIYSLTISITNHQAIKANGTPINFNTLPSNANINLITGATKKYFNDFTFYPNPVKDNLIITFPLGYNKLDVNIYNIEGRLISNKGFNTKTESNTQIDCSQLANGIYLCELRSNNIIIYRSKFVIEK